MKLSIVIPVYNVANYLRRCVKSCLSQDVSIDDYEIILVDDGSTDESSIIADALQDEYEIIRVIHQSNMGLSEARNHGFDIAKGDYVWFVDSDDWIQINSLSTIIKVCYENNLDVLSFCSADIIDYTPKRRYSYDRLQGVISGKEVLDFALYPPCIPFSVYKRAFLLDNHLRFFPGIFHEDSEFQPRAYFFAKRVLMSNDIFYFVYHSPNSIGRSFNTKKAYDQIIVVKNLREFLLTHGLDSCSGFHYRLGLALNNSLMEASIFPNENKAEYNKFLKKQRHLIIHLWKSKVVKYRIEYILFTLFPGHYTTVYSVLQRLK